MLGAHAPKSGRSFGSRFIPELCVTEFPGKVDGTVHVVALLEQDIDGADEVTHSAEHEHGLR